MLLRTLTPWSIFRCSTERLWADVRHDAAGDPAGENSEEPSTGDRAQGEHTRLLIQMNSKHQTYQTLTLNFLLKDKRISVLEDKQRLLKESGNIYRVWYTLNFWIKGFDLDFIFPVCGFREYTWSWKKVPTPAESSVWNGGKLI